MTQSHTPAADETPLSLGAHKLRQWRTNEGLARVEAGALLGVSETAIYFWETGKKVPRHGNLAKLRDLGVCKPNDWHEPAPPTAEEGLALQKAG